MRQLYIGHRFFATKALRHKVTQRTFIQDSNLVNLSAFVSCWQKGIEETVFLII